MRKYNDGSSEADQLQNQFTAYLLTAVKRHRMHYLKRWNRRLQTEILVEEIDQELPAENVNDFLENLSILEQIESPMLYLALMQARERDRYIFLTHALDERSFAELAKELGISYKATTHLYYRFVEKLRRLMGGEEK